MRHPFILLFKNICVKHKTKEDASKRDTLFVGYHHVRSSVKHKGDCP